MQTRELLPFAAGQCRGYRLHKLEVLNWGTFDGQVYTVRPNGKTALLIGQNGSGKSTLVDAILTLLVRPGVRNFNVAAGAKKRERDERTYIRGAYDRGADEDGKGIEVKFLRPKGGQYSVILACFHNEDTGKSFTAAQVLWLANDLSVDKIYCLSEDERSIQEDFGKLESADGILKTLRSRGCRATKTFQEFEAWFIKLTRVKAKAMEVFNQTVAVKDIHRLNDFIRDHMLEARNWDEKVDRLLSHFALLSEAHASLVRVRQQSELLEPVARIGTDFGQQAEALVRAERILAATDAYFSQRIVDLFTPEMERRKRELSEVCSSKVALAEEIRAAAEQARSLQHEIENVGGDRLRHIPVLIEKERACAETKRKDYRRFCDDLRRLELSDTCTDEAHFLELRQCLPTVRGDIEEEVRQSESERDQCTLQRADVRRELASLREELEGLRQRRENVPEWCVVIW